MLGAGRMLLSTGVDMRVWVSSVKHVEDTGIAWKGQGTWGYLGCSVGARKDDGALDRTSVSL